ATVLVKVRFLEKDPRILPEMSARVAFLRRPLKEAEMQPRTAVPASALVARGGEKVVFRVPEATARATAVITGMDMGEMVEIVRGVAAGDKVVLAPPPELDAGERVKIVE
ncbi:MAG: efflux RND transporter periplasmic adaptor subunit, partial [Desulfuromonadales bacterium]